MLWGVRDDDNFLELLPTAQSPALTSGKGFSPFLPHKKHPFFQSSFRVFSEHVIHLFCHASTAGWITDRRFLGKGGSAAKDVPLTTETGQELPIHQQAVEECQLSLCNLTLLWVVHSTAWERMRLDFSRRQG